MRASWHALHAGLTHTTTTLRFQREFEALRAQTPDVARFRDPAALFDWLHTPDGDGVARNQVLRVLVGAAQNCPEPAVTLILMALWPGLDAVRNRLSRHFRDHAALVSEITARVVQNIHALNLFSVTWIAATLIRNVERDIRRHLGVGWAEAKRHRDEPSGDVGGQNVAQSPFGIPVGLDADHAAVVLIERLGPMVGADAAVVVGVAVQGERQHEAAARLGCTPAAARKRYQRAIGRLRKEFGVAA